MTQDDEQAPAVRLDGFCPGCEQKVTFVASGPYLRNTFRCSNCLSLPRHRALKHVLAAYYPNWRDLAVHEASPGWDIVSQRLAAECASYTASYYDPSRPRGTVVAAPEMPCGSYRIENLENLTFADESFDLIVAQDVFEHIFFPNLAVMEVARTLRPGGAIIMTVPIVRRMGVSRRRAALIKGAVHHLVEPPEYHGDPLSDGALVTIDWGYDIAAYLSYHSGLSFMLVQVDNVGLGIRADLNDVLIGMKQPVPTL